MYKSALILIPLVLNIGFQPSKTLIKWTKNTRLNYSDFRGAQAPIRDSTASHDTMAVVNCYIKYNFDIISGKRVVTAYAAMDPEHSWMILKSPEVLKHEQGHFDLAEIFARKFEKAVNDTFIRDLQEYLVFVIGYYKVTTEEWGAENDKYDAWTRNAPGREYYYKWITEQLAFTESDTTAASIAH